MGIPGLIKALGEGTEAGLEPTVRSRNCGIDMSILLHRSLYRHIDDIVQGRYDQPLNRYSAFSTG